jgi:hypothetical protein
LLIVDWRLAAWGDSPHAAAQLKFNNPKSAINNESPIKNQRSPMPYNSSSRATDRLSNHHTSNRTDDAL